MAISLSLLTSAGETCAADNVVTTSSFTPADGSLLLVLCSYTAPYGTGSPEVTDTASLSWTRDIFADFNDGWGGGVCVFSAQVVTGQSMTVTFDTHAVSTDGAAGILVQVVQITGHNTTDPVVQTATDGGTTGYLGVWTDTLTSAPASDSYVVCVAVTESETPTVDDITTGTGWTVIGEQTSGITIQSSQYRTESTSTTVTFDNIQGDFIWAVGSIEIAAAVDTSDSAIDVTGAASATWDAGSAASSNLGAQSSGVVSWGAVSAVGVAFLSTSAADATFMSAAPAGAELDSESTSSASFGSAATASSLIGVDSGANVGFGADGYVEVDFSSSVTSSVQFSTLSLASAAISSSSSASASFGTASTISVGVDFVLGSDVEFAAASRVDFTVSSESQSSVTFSAGSGVESSASIDSTSSVGFGATSGSLSQSEMDVSSSSSISFGVSSQVAATVDLSAAGVVGFIGAATNASAASAEATSSGDFASTIREQEEQTSSAMISGGGGGGAFAHPSTLRSRARVKKNRTSVNTIKVGYWPDVGEHTSSESRNKVDDIENEIDSFDISGDDYADENYLEYDEEEALMQILAIAA
jgi:hypothetical protein